jgi:hypothetical protein
MSAADPAAQTVRDIIEASRYLVLAGPGRDVGPGAGLRLYRATADAYSILAKDGQPDHRVPVPLSG